MAALGGFLRNVWLYREELPEIGFPAFGLRRPARGLSAYKSLN
jgi:hypothetical protein